MLGISFNVPTLAVPAENPYSLELCKVILNPDAIEWYQLVAFDRNWNNPKNVKEDTCVEWVIYLLPDTLDLSNVKIKLIEETFEDRFDTCESRDPKWEVVNKWAIKLWLLESWCAHIDECSWCFHPNSSPSWTDRLKIKYNKDYGKKVDELDSLYTKELSKRKYVLSLYKRVDWIDEKNLKRDKFKAWNKESWEGNPVQDIYDERDIPWSLYWIDDTNSGSIADKTCWYNPYHHRTRLKWIIAWWLLAILFIWIIVLSCVMHCKYKWEEWIKKRIHKWCIIYTLFVVFLWIILFTMCKHNPEPLINLVELLR